MRYTYNRKNNAIYSRKASLVVKEKMREEQKNIVAAT